MPTVTLDYPANGGTVSPPFTATGHATPPGAVGALFDDTTVTVLGAVQSDAAGAWAITVSSFTANAFAAFGVNPSQGSATVQSASLATVAATGIGASFGSAVEKVGAALAATGIATSIGQSSLSGTQVSVASTAVAASIGSAAVSPGASEAATGIAPSVGSANPTMTAGASGFSFSDNFNRANGGLGANYGAQSGISGRFAVTTNQAAVGVGEFADRVVGTVADNQYAEVKIAGVPGDAYENGTGVMVRAASGAKTFYSVLANQDPDYGEDYLTLYKVVAGVKTQLGVYYPGGQYLAANPILRLLVSGTTLTVRTAPTHGGTYTTRITASDSAIASGNPGLHAIVASGGAQADDFYAADL